MLQCVSALKVLLTFCLFSLQTNYITTVSCLTTWLSDSAQTCTIACGIHAYNVLLYSIIKYVNACLFCVTVLSHLDMFLIECDAGFAPGQHGRWLQPVAHPAGVSLRSRRPLWARRRTTTVLLLLRHQGRAHWSALHRGLRRRRLPETVQQLPRRHTATMLVISVVLEWQL